MPPCTVGSARQQLVLLEKRYPLEEVIEAVAAYARRGGRRLAFEYTMIRDVNDALELVPPLAALVRQLRAARVASRCSRDSAWT